ncbi:unnamed protein product [Rhodiola kirilowii]
MGGNILYHLCCCFLPSNTNREDGANLPHQFRHPLDVLFESIEPLDETLRQSFYYVRSSAQVRSPTPSDQYLSPSHSIRCSPSQHDESTMSRHDLQETGFKAISGASVSANSITPRTVLEEDVDDDGVASSNHCNSGSLVNGIFEISSSFLAGSLSTSGLDEVLFSDPLGVMYAKKKRRKGISGLFRKKFHKNIPEKKGPWGVSVFSFVGIQEVPVESDGLEAEARIHEDSNVHWALGKAGEDRFHVVVSEEHGWLFVGIYDGFNGPDAPEVLLANFYRAIYNEIQGLFWKVEQGQPSNVAYENVDVVDDSIAEPPMVQGYSKKEKFLAKQSDSRRRRLCELFAEDNPDDGLDLSRSERFAFSIDDAISVNRAGSELVLNAMSRALHMTEAAYLDITDKFLDRNPELALMGSCLLVVLMRDEDVYVMNVGDSRAIVAQSEQQDKVGPSVDLEEVAESGESIEGIVKETPKTLSEKVDEIVKNHSIQVTKLTALQLSTDHNTSIEEEVLRIKSEHPDDSQCIVNDRVKGWLKVTRAFGAGFLKQPKWNDPLLEMFRNDYIGTAPYVSCTPSLHHHKLCQRDQFLVLSSDGLYQYLTNQEVVSHVDSFMEKSPEGDPAQHLIEELLSRAAKKAGMNLHELLDIPQGERRKYHDDVTVMVVSLEGRIWKSSRKLI